MRRFMSVLCCLAIVCSLLCPIGVVAAAVPEITINGSLRSFYREAVYENGTWLLPFKELMNKVGVNVNYDEEERAVVGEINGAEVNIPENSSVAHYDNVGIELLVPTKGIKDDVLVEARFIDMIYGADCTSTEKGAAFTFKQIVEEEKVELVDDVDEYLKTLKPKNYVIKQEDISKAAISDPSLVSMKLVEVDDAPGFTQAVEVNNLKDKISRYWDSQITINTTDAAAAGDVMVATFYVKKISCVDESGYGTIASTFEAMDSAWTKFYNVDGVQVPGEWTKYRYVFNVTKDLNPGTAHFCIRVGYRIQTLRIGGIEVVNYGKRADIRKIKENSEVKTTYYGREDGALWREEALRRIEKYRKNDIKINVKDENGKPIKDAKVKAEMTRSEFLWGDALQEQKFFDGGNSGLYQETVKKDFNSVVMETATKPAGYNVMRNVQGVNFVRENNMYFRAHAILWDAMNHFPPGFSSEATEEEVLTFCLEHASRIIDEFGDSITEMDVLNEALNNKHFQTKYGREFIAKIFKVVHDMAPDIKLFINETGVMGNDGAWPAVYQLRGIIDELQALGAPVQGVGIQDHASGFMYPQTLYNQLDYLAENLDYIAITEYDYTSFLADNVEMDKLEADYLRDSMIITYSHPKATSFTMWGFTDFGHWKNHAPLYYADMQPKPAYNEWRKYAWGEWFTNEERQTDDKGEAVIRGHRGEYDITVEYGGKTAKTTLVLTKDGLNTVDVIIGNTVSAVSSQEVEGKKLPQINAEAATYEKDIAAQAYKKMYENCAKEIKGALGENLNFLLNDSNNSVYSVNKSKSVTVKLDKTMNSGFVDIKTKGKREAQLKIYAVGDFGEELIYSGEGKDGSLVVKFETDGVKEIKIQGLLNSTSILKNVKISEKEDNVL